MFAEIVTSPPVGLPVSDEAIGEPVVIAEPEPVGLAEPEYMELAEPEPVRLAEPEPVGLAEDRPTAVLDVTPVPGPVTPPLIVEDASVADAKILLVKLERSEVTPLRIELRMLVSDAVEVADAVETPVPGPETPPEIVEDTSVAVSDTVDDAALAPVLGPVTPPETVEETSVAVSDTVDDTAVTPVLGPLTPPEIVEDASVADMSVDVPRRVLVKLETSEPTLLIRELRRPPLDVVVAGAVVAVAVVPVPAPVIPPETVVSVSELVVVSEGETV